MKADSLLTPHANTWSMIPAGQDVFRSALVKGSLISTLQTMCLASVNAVLVWNYLRSNRNVDWKVQENPKPPSPSRLSNVRQFWLVWRSLCEDFDHFWPPIKIFLDFSTCFLEYLPSSSLWAYNKLHCPMPDYLQKRWETILLVYCTWTQTCWT